MNRYFNWLKQLPAHGVVALIDLYRYFLAPFWAEAAVLIPPAPLTENKLFSVLGR